MIDDINGQWLDGLEFCTKVYALFEKIRAEPDGSQRIRLRSGLVEKRLMDELLPICRYVQTYYRLGRYISVRWIDGSQSYDAELHQSGDYVTQGYYAQQAYLEATCAMHQNEHWIRKLLDQGGVAFAPEGINANKNSPLISEPVVFTNSEHVLKFAPIVVTLIQKKSEISYPQNTSLVVQCHLNSLYTPAEWHLLVAEIEREIKVVPFQEILLFDATTERATPLTIDKR